MALWNVCAVWTCGFCVLFVEELDGACVGVVLLLASGPASQPIVVLYEDFRLKRTHPLIMGNERGVVG